MHQSRTCALAVLCRKALATLALALILVVATGAVAQAGFTTISGPRAGSPVVSENWLVWQEDRAPDDLGYDLVHFNLTTGAKTHLPQTLQRGVGEFALAGDWLCCAVGISNSEFFHVATILEATNLVTGEKRTIAEYHDEEGGIRSYIRALNAGDSWLVWTELMPGSETTYRLKAYDFRSGATTTVDEGPIAEQNLGLSYNDAAIDGDRLLRNATYSQMPDSSSVSLTDLASRQTRRLESSSLRLTTRSYRGKILALNYVKGAHVTTVHSYDPTTGVSAKLYTVPTGDIYEQDANVLPLIGDWLVLSGNLAETSVEHIYLANLVTRELKHVGATPSTSDVFFANRTRLFARVHSNDPFSIAEADLAAATQVYKPTLSRTPTGSKYTLKIRKVKGRNDYVAPNWTLHGTLKRGSTPLRNHRVYLELSWNGGEWRRTWRGTTDSKGRVKATLPSALGIVGFGLWRSPGARTVRWCIDPVEGKSLGAASSAVKLTIAR